MDSEYQVQILAPFLVHYQPIVDLLTHRMVGCEALARWPTPDSGVRGPGRFIDGIESDLSLAEDLTEHVLLCVRRDLGDFLSATPDFYVSTNIPAVLLGAGRLHGMLAKAGFDGLTSRIVMEVTERRAVDENGRQALRIAREMGVRIALDDFGTGSSGFHELLGMEIDILKIGRSLIEPLNNDIISERLVRGLAMFAAMLRIRLVAEGVETREQAAFLRAGGVDCGQGWLWSKAVSPDELIAMHRANAPLLTAY